MNIVVDLRNREQTGQMGCKRLADTLRRELIELYNHEWMFDHPKLYNVLEHLLERLSSKWFLAVLSVIFQSEETCEDRSIIIVASKFCRMTNDFSLVKLIDEIKTDTL